MNNLVVIIGAGPAGLTAAYELTKLGSGVVVLEADQRGGLARTVNTETAYHEDGHHLDERAGDRSILGPHTAGLLSPDS